MGEAFGLDQSQFEHVTETGGSLGLKEAFWMFPVISSGETCRKAMALL
jgi:hypothetical protein